MVIGNSRIFICANQHPGVPNDHYHPNFVVLLEHANQDPGVPNDQGIADHVSDPSLHKFTYIFCVCIPTKRKKNCSIVFVATLTLCQLAPSNLDILEFPMITFIPFSWFYLSMPISILNKQKFVMCMEILHGSTDMQNVRSNFEIK